MTEAVREFLKSFDRLPEAERREASSEILKRSRIVYASHPSRVASASLSEEDEELARLAALTFLELDARESADGKP